MIELILNINFKFKVLYPKPGSNRHGRNGQGILSPSCLPFHHSSIQWRAENEARTRDPNLGKEYVLKQRYWSRATMRK